MNTKLRSMTAIYITRGNEMLLLYRVGSRVVASSWCGIGGHFERDELNDPRACVLRELEEEVGLTANDLESLRLRYVTLRLKNGEIRQNYYFFADLRPSADLPDHCDEGTLRWIPYPEILNREMPHTAKHVLEHYLAEGRHTQQLYCGASDENGTPFSVLREF